MLRGFRAHACASHLSGARLHMYVCVFSLPVRVVVPLAYSVGVQTPCMFNLSSSLLFASLRRRRRQVGEASNIEYRSVSGIDAYVPLLNVRELTDPLLAMDVNDLPSK